MRALIFPLIAVLAQSCQVYKSSFDCAPKEGIPCKSVTEIEAMIVESKSGPDILIERDEQSPCVVQRISKKGASNDSKNFKKIWIPEKNTHSGVKIEGHHIYFQENACD